MTLDLTSLSQKLARAIPDGRAVVESREVWTFDRSKFLNASEAAACIRWNWFAKRNPDVAFRPNGFARRGSHAELYMVEALKAAGYVVVDALDDQVSIQDEEGKLSASPDGFVIGDAETLWSHAVYIELKTIDPRTNRGNLPRERHVRQVELGMEIADEVVDLERPDGTTYSLPIAGGVILYMDASDFDQVDPFVVERRPAVMDWALERHRKVFGARKLTSLDREGKKTGECKTCPFAAECLGGEDMEGPAIVGRGNRGSKFDELVNAYGIADEAEKAAKAEKEALKEDVLKELRKRNAPSLDVGDWTVTRSARAGQTKLDKASLVKRLKELSEEHGFTLDISDFETVGKPSEALAVKRRA